MVDAVNKTIRGLGRVLLGLFVLWQVVFLFTSLAIKIEATWRKQAPSRAPFFQESYRAYLKGEDPIHETLSYAEDKGLHRYAQATAQHQLWKLFAPSVADDFSFAELEVRWDDDHLPSGFADAQPLEPLLLPGVNEPDDVNAFVRYKNFRMRRYEMHLAPSPPGRDGAFDPRTEAWRRRIADAVGDDGGYMVAYLRWRWDDYQRQHAETTLPAPTQVVLYVRGYGIPQPPGPSPWRFEEYGRHAVARWLPWAREQSGVQALQRYNPLTDTYESAP